MKYCNRGDVNYPLYTLYFMVLRSILTANLDYKAIVTYSKKFFYYNPTELRNFLEVVTHVYDIWFWWAPVLLEKLIWTSLCSDAICIKRLSCLCSIVFVSGRQRWRRRLQTSDKLGPVTNDVMRVLVRTITITPRWKEHEVLDDNEVGGF